MAGAEKNNERVVQRFQELFSQAKYKQAAELAAESPQGLLRTTDTIYKFQSVPMQSGQTPPLLEYLETLLTRGKLNAFESLELSRLVVNQSKKNLLDNWLAEDKLECSEELGDLVKTVDYDLAVKIYIKARATPKVVAAFAERREFDKILIYSKQVGYTPPYLFLLRNILKSDPQVAVNFALMMSQMEGGCPVDCNTITDLFLERNLFHEATTFLLDVLKPNLQEHGYLQTKVLEFNLVNCPNVADDILANGMFSHYDRPRIAQLCEKAGLYLQALQHYTELLDIKRVIVNTHAIEPQSLVKFFGTLSREWALECMKDLLLVNLSGNLQIIVQAAKEYAEQLGVDACIKLFEQFRSYEGLYFFLGCYLSSSEDPDIHFKYIEAAAKTGQIKELEHVTRESNCYHPEKTMNFLMEANLPDARPLINVCDRFGYVSELTHYLYTNDMLQYIASYVQKVNPGNVPIVVGQLLDDECPQDFIKGLVFRSLLPVQPLVEECEKSIGLRLTLPIEESDNNPEEVDSPVFASSSTAKEFALKYLEEGRELVVQKKFKQATDVFKRGLDLLRVHGERIDIYITLLALHGLALLKRANFEEYSSQDESTEYVDQYLALEYMHIAWRMAQEQSLCHTLVSTFEIMADDMFKTEFLKFAAELYEGLAEVYKSRCEANCYCISLTLFKLSSCLNRFEKYEEAYAACKKAMHHCATRKEYLASNSTLNRSCYDNESERIESLLVRLKKNLEHNSSLLPYNMELFHARCEGLAARVAPSLNPDLLKLSDDSSDAMYLRVLEGEQKRLITDAEYYASKVGGVTTDPSESVHLTLSLRGLIDSLRFDSSSERGSWANLYS